jgi:hypothetical protein
MREHGMNGRLSEEGLEPMNLVPAEWHFCIDVVEIEGVKKEESRYTTTL